MTRTMTPMTRCFFPPPVRSRQPLVASVLSAAGKVRSATEEIIRIRAYRKWEAAGKPAGDGSRFWLEAEQELLLLKQESCT